MENAMNILLEGQPRISELNDEFGKALSSEGVDRVNAINSLIEMREKRTTWFGNDQLVLRWALVNFIEGNTK